MADTCWICRKEKGQPPERCPGHYEWPSISVAGEEAVQQDLQVMANAVPCLHENHPVFLRNDFSVVAHYTTRGARCRGSESKYPAHIAQSFARADALLAENTQLKQERDAADAHAISEANRAEDNWAKFNTARAQRDGLLKALKEARRCLVMEGYANGHAGNEYAVMGIVDAALDTRKDPNLNK